MYKKIGIFAQERNATGRMFNNLSFDYVRALEKAGGICIIVPIFSQYIHEYIDMCDAFVFTGGPDIDPSLYGQIQSGSRGISPEYDQYLLAAMQYIFTTGKPILGICKWMQLLSVAHGGTLRQDIDEQTYHFQPERWYECIDTIDILGTDSFLSAVYAGTHEICVNSIHHQAVDTVWKKMRVVARSQYDHEVEAIEHISLPYYGVQWHPEYLREHDRLFRWYIQSI